jgi:hypothetical protein
MNEQNKNNLKLGLKKLALIVYAFLTIGTCAGVWNYCPETTVKVLAGILFVCNGFAIVRLWKKTDKE